MAKIHSTIVHEGRYAGEVLVSEANGNRSRDNAVIAGPITFEPGTILAVKTSDGSVRPYDFRGTLTDYDEVASIAVQGVKLAAGETAEIAILARDAEVSKADVVIHQYDATVPNAGQVNTAFAALKALGIIGR